MGSARSRSRPGRSRGGRRGRKADVARRLGADEVVDYGEPDWTAGAGAVGVVFVGVGGGIAREVVTLLGDGRRADLLAGAARLATR